MADSPEKSPGAGLWKYGRKAALCIAHAVRWSVRAVFLNRASLMSLISVAMAIVKLVSAILELFRRF